MTAKYIFLLLVVLTIGLTGSTALAQCSVGDKQALYQSFLDNRTGDQTKAYEAAKKYLACNASSDTEAERKILDYLKKFTAVYDRETRKLSFKDLLYKQQKYSEAYALVKEILAAEPEDLETLVHAGANGYLVVPLEDISLNAQALDYANRALKQLEAGKTLSNWYPLSRDLALAYNNFTAGSITLLSNPSIAVDYLIKAAQFDTPLRKSPFTFAYIAGAYETGDYAKQLEVYKRDFAGKEETAQTRLALANINQTVDRMVDGFARAVALAGNDPQFAKNKLQWSESLKKWYTFRNESDAGMYSLLSTILSKPLPSRPTQLTSIP
jgi:hypothetical protein